MTTNWSRLTCPSTLSTAMHLPSDSVRISWLLGASMRQQHSGSSSMASVSMASGPSDKPAEPKQPAPSAAPRVASWKYMLTYSHI